MALEIIELNPDKPALSQKFKITLCALSFFIGSIILTGAFFYKGNNNFFGINNQSILKWFVDIRKDYLTPIISQITNIASPTNIVVATLVVVLFWFVIKRELTRPGLLVGAVTFAAGISTILKELIKNPRPEQSMMIKPFELDYSFPSGHAICTATFIFILSYLIFSRRFSWSSLIGWFIISIISIAIIAVSRLYLGYHWMTDVVASIGLSLIILGLVILIDIIIEKINQ